MEGGALEVGITPDGREIVINHPDLARDERGVAHIIFSPEQARHLARLLMQKADDIERVADVDWREWAATLQTQLDAMRLDRNQALTALRESVKLQSHYANLLNMHDGGQRLEFATVDDWLKRVAEVASRPR